MGTARGLGDVRGACGEQDREAGEIRDGRDERHLHADLGLPKEACDAGAEACHARDLPFDEEALFAVLAVRVGFGVLTRVDEQHLVGTDLDGL
jgi:hypothetical protein